MRFAEYLTENVTARSLDSLGEFTDERGRTYDLVVRKSGGCVAIFPHRGSTVFEEMYQVDTDDPWEVRGAMIELVLCHHDTVDNPYELDGGEMSYTDD